MWISLSYGTNSTQSYGVDPLAYAVEQAWKHGIVVVAAAGNTGYQRGDSAPGLADPGYDPFIIAAGASTSNGTPGISDDAVAPFSASSSGCGACKNPDSLAPGAHLQGLRVPNSFVDMNHPEGRLDDRYFRGSGTSESTAVVAGAVALVLEKYPTMSPDLVKRFFQTNAQKLASFDSQAQGVGEIRLGAMLTATPQWSYKVPKFANATGTGSLERSRPGSPDPRRRRPRGRAGRLRAGRRHLGARNDRGRGQLVVRRRLERRLVVGQLLVGIELVRELVVGKQLVGELLGPEVAGRAAAGRAVRGRAVRGSGSSWSGSSSVRLVLGLGLPGDELVEDGACLGMERRPRRGRRRRCYATMLAGLSPKSCRSAISHGGG